MSYILNALRKAEQARQGTRPSNLQSTILHPSQATESKRGLLLTLVLCNVALLLLFVVYLWQSSTPETQLTRAPGAATVPVDNGQQSTDAAAPSSGESGESLTALARQTKPDKESASTIAEMAKQKQVRKRPEKTASGTHPPVRKRQGGAQQKSVARSPGGRGQPQNPEPGIARRGNEPPHAAEPATVVAMLPNPLPPPKTSSVVKARPAPSRRAPAVDPLPLLNELPYSIRRKFPKLNINVYVYSNDPRERFMIVDMVRFQEGQKMTGKVVLKEIRPDDFVVSFEGRTFRVPRP